MAIEYRCPRCGDTENLGIEIPRIYLMKQGADLQCEVELMQKHFQADPEWDDDSHMWCRCGHDGPAHEFIIEEE